MLRQKCIGYYDPSMQLFEKYLQEYRHKKVLESVNKYPHDNILEIGCGTVPHYYDIEDFIKYIIVEPHKRSTDYLRRKMGVTVLNSKLEDIKDELRIFYPPFDFIIASSVLHWADNIDKFMKALASVCRSNTIVHINVTNEASLHKILGEALGRTETDSRQKTKFTSITLVNLLYDYGFEVLEHGTYIIKPLPNEQMSKIINKELMIGLEKMIADFPLLGCEIFVEIKKL